MLQQYTLITAQTIVSIKAISGQPAPQDRDSQRPLIISDKTDGVQVAALPLLTIPWRSPCHIWLWFHLALIGKTAAQFQPFDSGLNPDCLLISSLLALTSSAIRRLSLILVSFSCCAASF